MRNNHRTPALAVQHRRVKGRRMVLLEEAEYERLRQKAEEWEPPMPEPDANGNYAAVEALRVQLARKIIRDRLKTGLSQQELARRAGIRLDTLRRLETGKHTASVSTIDKIDKALKNALKASK